MKMRTKIFLLIIFLSVLFLVAVLLTKHSESKQRDEFLRTFRIEKEVGLTKSIDSYSNSIRTYAYDYTFWDEMVNFLATRSRKWAYENIETTLGTFNVHYVWIYQTDFSLAYSVNTPEFPPVKYLPFQKDVLQQIISMNKFNHFFIQKDSQLCEIYLAPIQPSSDLERTSEPKGYFFVGRIWTRKVLEDLSSLTLSDISLVPEWMDSTKDQLEKKQDYSIVLTRTLSTWDNKPIAQLISTSEQSFLKTSVTISTIRFWTLIIFILVILTVITWFLIRYIDKPIRTISTCLEESNPQILEKLKTETSEFGNFATLIDQFFQQKERLIKEFEERIKAEQRMKDIVDNAPFGAHIYELKAEQQLVFIGANRAADSILELDNQQFIGKTIEEAFPNLIKTEVPDAYRRVAATGERYDADQVVYTLGDTHGILEVHAFQIGSNLMATFFRDITARKQAEDKLREREQHLFSIYDTVADVIFHLAVEGEGKYRFLSINQAFCNTTGLSQEQVVGKLVNEVIPEPSLTLVLEKYKQAIDENRIVRWEEISDYPTGRLTGEVSIAPVMDDNGRCTHLVGSVHDISERILMEETQKASETRYRRLFESAKDGILILDAETGKIVDVNPFLITILGYTREQFLGKAIWELGTFKDIIANIDNFTELQQKGYVRYEDRPLETADGRRIDVEFVSNVYLVNEQKVIQCNIRDITERKRNKEALEKSEEQLRQTQKLEAIGQLASGIAHDFNNILAIIMGHSQLLKMGSQSPNKAKHSIETITKTSKRGADLVKQLLTLARRSEPLITPVDIMGLINETVKMLSATFPKIIIFQTDIQLSLPFILADASQINQVLMNLCINARDAMPQGGILRITAKRESGETLRKRRTEAVAAQYIEISVSDTGIGMDQATIDRIFEPFFTTKGLGKGTGLGLATVHGIVINHSGFIEVESKPGAGTKVTIYLPFIMDSEILVSEEAGEFQKIIGGNETILIIDDEELITEMLNIVLKNQGYRILIARDGLEGIDVYTREKDKIALVLTDMGLPKLAGDVVFHRIREINPQARVILVSGYLSPDNKSELYKAGLARFIQKPFLPIDILKTIREVLDSN